MNNHISRGFADNWYRKFGLFRFFGQPEIKCYAPMRIKIEFGKSRLPSDDGDFFQQADDPAALG